MATTDRIPIVEASALGAGTARREEAARRIDRACRDHGFFYVVEHGVEPQIEFRLAELARAFFAQDEAAKLALRMELGGRAWRGYFPVGAELTSGRPDQKEGLYFGAELDPDHPKVAAGVPLHGPNLFPSLAGFRSAVLEYMDAMTRLGHILVEGIALALGLPASYFADRYTRDPLILFRIFHYPPLEPLEPLWSVGEHTDYGLLTILRQDDAGGLSIGTRSGWIDAPPLPGAYVCNIGDMLDRMTGGRYRSTPHRVRNQSRNGRLSFPFFFDPAWDARIEPIDPEAAAVDDRDSRWDHASVHAFDGSYGDYLLAKVSKVFPRLGDQVL